MCFFNSDYLDIFQRLRRKQMQDNQDNELKEIEAQQFITPKDRLGYAEEYITVDSMLLNYSLSNSLEDIRIAIFKRTGLDIKLEKAKWQINPCLSISVKHLMNKHQVIYSMTSYYEEKVRIIGVNMRVGDKWFFTFYTEFKGKCYSYDYFEMLDKLKRYIEKFLNKDDESED